MFRVTILGSGSSGNSLLIDAGNTRLLVDAGVGKRVLCESLKGLGCSPDQLSAILITHEHRDHTSGITWLATRLGIPVYATEGTWTGDLKGPLGKLRERVPVNQVTPGMCFNIGTVSVYPFKTSHDAEQPCGYRFECDGKTIAVATDLGHVSDEVRSGISEVNLLVLESNHDQEMLLQGGYPWFLKKRILSKKGHLSNRDAGNALAELYTKKMQGTILAHLSEENNTEELAFNTVKRILEEHGISVGIDLELKVANRYGVTGPFVVA